MPSTAKRGPVLVHWAARATDVWRAAERAWAARRLEINTARLKRWKANRHPVDGAPGHVLQRYREAAETRSRFGFTTTDAAKL